MAASKLTDRVRTHTGEVVTLAELNQRGELTFARTDGWYVRGGKYRTAYFAEHVGHDGACWEITATTYKQATA